MPHPALVVGTVLVGIGAGILLYEHVYKPYRERQRESQIPVEARPRAGRRFPSPVEKKSHDEEGGAFSSALDHPTARHRRQGGSSASSADRVFIPPVEPLIDVSSPSAPHFEMTEREATSTPMFSDAPPPLVQPSRISTPTSSGRSSTIASPSVTAVSDPFSDARTDDFDHLSSNVSIVTLEDSSDEAGSTPAVLMSPQFSEMEFVSGGSGANSTAHSEADWFEVRDTDSEEDAAEPQRRHFAAAGSTSSHPLAQ